MRYVLDSSVASYYVWGKIIGVDKANKFIKGKCEEKNTNWYRCVLHTDRGNKIEFNITENELKSLAYTVKARKEGRSYVFDVSERIINRLKRVIEKVANTCSRNQCYVAPDLGIAFQDGNIINPFTLSINKGKISYVPKDRIFNKVLFDELINKYNIKVLVDRDLEKFIGKENYNRLVDNLRRVYGNRVDTDASNVFRPIIKLLVDNKEVLVDISEGKIIYGNKEIRPLPVKPAEMKVYEVLSSAGVEIQSIKEAVKRVETYKEGKMKKFHPEVAIVDAYVRAIAHDDVKVITTDMDILGVNVRVEPKKKENVILV